MFRWISVGALALVPTSTYLLLYLRAAAPLSDPDTWWHLVMGHKFLDGTSIRNPGPMSYFGTEDWHPRDWLAQVVAAKFEDWFGLAGVAWLFGLGMVVFAVVVYRACRTWTSFAAAAITTPIAVIGSMSSLTARPHLISFIFLAVVVGGLLRTVDDQRPRWWIAVLTGVWACTHGMWFLSIALQGAVLVGLLLDRRLDRPMAARLSGLLLLTVAAVGITPNGLYLLAKPLGTSLQIAPYIQEYDPPTIASLYYAVTLAMIGLTVLVWARRSRPSWTEIILVVAAAGFAVQMQRTVTIGAVIVTPLFARAIDEWLKKLDLTVGKLFERILVYGGAVVALVCLGITAPVTADRPGHNFPVGFDAQIDQLPDSAVLFNELSDGGYLTWRHPGLRVVEDGLSDQYSTNYHLDYFRTVELEDGWERFFERTHANYALLTEHHPLRQALELSGWTEMAHDLDKVLLQQPKT